MKIVTDIRLWQLLQQGVKKQQKLTKMEAFYDLIDRQQMALLSGTDDYIRGSVLEFSKAWGWDRETVMRFLDHLEQLEVITIQKAGNRKVVKLNFIKED